MAIKLERVHLSRHGASYEFSIYGRKTRAYDTNDDGILDDVKFNKGLTNEQNVRKVMQDFVTEFHTRLPEECAKAAKLLEISDKYRDGACSMSEWLRKNPDAHALDHGSDGHIDYVEFTDTKGVVTKINAFVKAELYLLVGRYVSVDSETRQQLARYFDMFDHIDDGYAVDAQAKNIWIASGISLYESIADDIYRPTFEESLKP